MRNKQNSEDATRRRAAELELSNSIDDDYAAAQKRYTDAVEASARAAKEVQEAAVREAAARNQAIADIRQAKVAKYEEQYNSLSQTGQRLLIAKQPDFRAGKGDLLTNEDLRLEPQARSFQDLIEKFVQSPVAVESCAPKDLPLSHISILIAVSQSCRAGTRT